MASPEDKADLAPRPSLESEGDAGFEIVARPVPPPAPRMDEPDQPRQSGRGGANRTPAQRGLPIPARLARVAAVAALCAALPALLAFRAKVVAVVPGTASLYRQIGLPVNLVGLTFANVRSTLSQDGVTPVLEVAGEIVNDGPAARTVPWLHVALLGDGGQSLYRWSARAADGELRVGETIPFRVRLTAPPLAAKSVEVTFRDAAMRSASTLN